MLPAVVNGQLCDRCELSLSELAKVASERTFAFGNNNNSSSSRSGGNDGNDNSTDAMQSPKQASPYYLQLQQRQL